MPAASAAAAPELSIRVGRVDPGGLRQGQRLGPHVHGAPGLLWFCVPGVARFLVAEGREIVVDPAPGVDEEDVRVYLLGSAVGALLHQRGLLVLHGNAVRVGAAAVVCLGASGSGKSTLAAAFVRRGHPALVDDAVPIDAGGQALPGVPRLKLRGDAVRRLGIDPRGLRAVHPEAGKFSFPLEGPQFHGDAVPVRRLYVLGVHDGPGIAIERPRGAHCLQPLVAHTYRYAFVMAMGLQASHLGHCGRLVGSAGLRLLRRPVAGVGPDAVVDALISDLAGG